MAAAGGMDLFLVAIQVHQALGKPLMMTHDLNLFSLVYFSYDAIIAFIQAHKRAAKKFKKEVRNRPTLKLHVIFIILKQYLFTVTFCSSRIHRRSHSQRLRKLYWTNPPHRYNWQIMLSQASPKKMLK